MPKKIWSRSRSGTALALRRDEVLSRARKVEIGDLAIRQRWSAPRRMALKAIRQADLALQLAAEES